MKICIVTNHLYGGGAERVICNLSNYLVDKNVRVRIILLHNSKQTYELNPSVQVDCISKKRIRSKFLLYRLLKKNIVRDSSDCYISFLSVPTIFMLMMKKHLNAPLICSERNDPRHYGFLIKTLLKRFAGRADGFVFQTSKAKAWYQNHLKKTKTIIIQNAINAIGTNNNNHTELKRIVSAGRLIKQKDFPLLLNAFSDVHSVHPEYSLHIYGCGKLLKKLKALSSKLNIDNCVFFDGFIPNLSAELSKSEIFVLSSKYEGMPNVLIEAMSLGKACVSTNCNGVYELLSENRGIVLTSRSKKEMSKALNFLIDNPKIRFEYGEKAMEINNLFAPNVVYNAWLSFICSTINGNHV